MHVLSQLDCFYVVVNKTVTNKEEGKDQHLVLLASDLHIRSVVHTQAYMHSHTYKILKK